MAIPKILLFYIFTPLADPDAVRLWQRDLCAGLGLRGRILISKDGLNGTVGGDLPAIKKYIRKTRDYPAFKNIDFKWSEGTGLDESGQSLDFPKLVVKVRDEIGGAITPHWASKPLQASDRKKLDQGVGMARDILAAAGAQHIFQSRHFAAHPGGSVRIGDGVDSDLQAVGATNLFVCDASVIPQAWGLPPTLTLLCLGTRLGEYLAARWAEETGLQ